MCAGWGLVSCPNPQTNPYCSGGVAAAALQELQLPVVSHEVCSDTIGTFGRGKVGIILTAHFTQSCTAGVLLGRAGGPERLLRRLGQPPHGHKPHCRRGHALQVSTAMV